MKKLRPPVKTHGGKYHMAPFIIDNFPQDYENLNYSEIFVGGGSVLLQKKKSSVEQICDIDWNIISVWRALKLDSKEFISRLMALPYSAETFEASKNFLEDQSQTHCSPVDLAVHEYVVRRMSRGGMRKAFAWSKRLRGGKPGDLNAWETALGSLPSIIDRIKDVILRHHDFRSALYLMDDSNYLLYLDPPYLKSTRAKGATNIYAHEMSDQDHEHMLKLCNSSRAKILISGYESSMYETRLSSWNKVYKDIANHSSQAIHKSTKREVVWKNF